MGTNYDSISGNDAFVPEREPSSNVEPSAQTSVGSSGSRTNTEPKSRTDESLENARNHRDKLLCKYDDLLIKIEQYDDDHLPVAVRKEQEEALAAARSEYEEAITRAAALEAQFRVHNDGSVEAASREEN